eukprot:724506-Prorocentrum_minimum.AAC.2
MSARQLSAAHWVLHIRAPHPLSDPAPAPLLAPCPPGATEGDHSRGLHGLRGAHVHPRRPRADVGGLPP